MKASSLSRRVWYTLGLSLLVAAGAQAAQRRGYAVTANVTGNVQYSGPGGKGALARGVALSQGHTVTVGHNASLCSALTPGAILGVESESELTYTRLEMVTEGLPDGTKPTQRHIGMELKKGAVIVNGGPTDTNLDIQVVTPAGTITSDGGVFTVVVEGNKVSVIVESGAITFTSTEGKTTTANAGQMVTAEPAKVDVGDAPDGRLGHTFPAYEAVVDQLEPIVHGPNGADLDALKEWLTGKDPLRLLGDSLDAFDVSPSTRNLGSIR